MPVVCHIGNRAEAVVHARTAGSRYVRCEADPYILHVSQCQGSGNNRSKCDEKQPCGNCTRRHDSCSLVALSTIPRRRLAKQLVPRTTGHTSRGDVSSPRTDALLQNISLPSIQEPANAPADPNDAIEPATVPRTARIQQLLLQLTEQVSLLDRDASSVGEASAESPPCGISAVPSDAFGKITPRDWLRDLYLFHHYCSVTSLTLADDASVQAVWRDVVPQTACLHHSGDTAPNCRLAVVYSQSSQYQATELPYLPAQRDHRAYDEQLPDRRAASQGRGCDHRIQDIISLPSALEWLKNGPVASLIIPTKRAPANAVNGFLDRVDGLKYATRDIARRTGSTSVISACLVAIDALKSAYQAIFEPTASPGSMWLWPMSLSQAFLDLIHDRHPAAVIILAHFVVLVHPSEKDRWYLKGWSSGVVMALENAVDETWKQWIEWPLQHVHGAIAQQEVP
ncbi:hypothetical protein BP6252_02980 [Coleophoma cylindrospora]|uniref:Zn(2)-C6 fungal-type domain-containing protein n=1 Tax=Coleophoma cylindrospora TaxID=1849047 RepID=A0A3D8S6G8_9HELO|nr:hypothetical protein BP6252_02980 [Coleophoma cylindrospora]